MDHPTSAPAPSAASHPVVPAAATTAATATTTATKAPSPPASSSQRPQPKTQHPPPGPPPPPPPLPPSFNSSTTNSPHAPIPSTMTPSRVAAAAAAAAAASTSLFSDEISPNDDPLVTSTTSRDLDHLFHSPLRFTFSALPSPSPPSGGAHRPTRKFPTSTSANATISASTPSATTPPSATAARTSAKAENSLDTASRRPTNSPTPPANARRSATSSNNSSNPHVSQSQQPHPPPPPPPPPPSLPTGTAHPQPQSTPQQSKSRISQQENPTFHKSAAVTQFPSSQPLSVAHGHMQSYSHGHGRNQPRNQSQNHYTHSYNNTQQHPHRSDQGGQVSAHQLHAKPPQQPPTTTHHEQTSRVLSQRAAPLASTVGTGTAAGTGADAAAGVLHRTTRSLPAHFHTLPQVSKSLTTHHPEMRVPSSAPMGTTIMPMSTAAMQNTIASAAMRHYQHQQQQPYKSHLQQHAQSNTQRYSSQPHLDKSDGCVIRTNVHPHNPEQQHQQRQQQEQQLQSQQRYQQQQQKQQQQHQHQHHQHQQQQNQQQTLQTQSQGQGHQGRMLDTALPIMSASSAALVHPQPQSHLQAAIPNTTHAHAQYAHHQQLQMRNPQAHHMKVQSSVYPHQRNALVASVVGNQVRSTNGASSSMAIRKGSMSPTGMQMPVVMSIGPETVDGHSSVSGDGLGTTGNGPGLGLPGGVRKKAKVKLKASNKVSTAEAVRMAAQMDRPPTRRSSKGGWTCEEDDMLRVVVMEHSEKNWKDIACALNRSFPGSNRNDVQCLHRWQKVLQPGLKKGPWTPHEDETITRLVGSLGASKWSLIAKQLPGRIGKQCRERWFNHLNPDINKNPWTETEERILQEAHSKFGNKWAIIAKYLPGRTDNAIKNHYNATKRRAATRRGRKPKAGNGNNIQSKTMTSPTLSEANTSTTTTTATATTPVPLATAAGTSAQHSHIPTTDVTVTVKPENMIQDSQTHPQPVPMRFAVNDTTGLGSVPGRVPQHTATTFTTTAGSKDGIAEEMRSAQEGQHSAATETNKIVNRPPPLNLSRSRCGRGGNGMSSHHHHHHSGGYLTPSGGPLSDVTNKAPTAVNAMTVSEHGHGNVNTPNAATTAAIAAATAASSQSVVQEKVKEYNSQRILPGFPFGYGLHRRKRLPSPSSAPGSGSIRRAAKRAKANHSTDGTNVTDENVNVNMNILSTEQQPNTLVTTSSHDMDMALDGSGVGVMSPLGMGVGDENGMSNFAAYMNGMDLIMTPKSANHGGHGAHHSSALDTPVTAGQLSRLMGRGTPTKDSEGETTNMTARRLHESSPEFHTQICTPRGERGVGTPQGRAVNSSRQLLDDVETTHRVSRPMDETNTNDILATNGNGKEGNEQNRTDEAAHQRKEEPTDNNEDDEIQKVHAKADDKMASDGRKPQSPSEICAVPMDVDVDKQENNNMNLTHERPDNKTPTANRRGSAFGTDDTGIVSTTFSTPPRLLFADPRGSALRMNVHLSGGLGASPSPAFVSGGGSGSLLRSPFLNSPRAFTPGVVMMGLNQTPGTSGRGLGNGSANGGVGIGSAGGGSKRLMYGLTPGGKEGLGSGSGLLPPMFSPGSLSQQMVTVTGMLRDDAEVGGGGMGSDVAGNEEEWTTKRQLFASTPTQARRLKKRDGEDEDEAVAGKEGGGEEARTGSDGRSGEGAQDEGEGEGEDSEGRTGGEEEVGKVEDKMARQAAKESGAAKDGSGSGSRRRTGTDTLVASGDTAR